MRLIDADAIYPWYLESFDFNPNEVRFSINDIRENLDNIPTHTTPSNTLGALDCVERQKAIDAIEEMQKPIMRSNFSHEQFIFCGMSEARQAIIDLPPAHPRKGKWLYRDGTIAEEYIYSVYCSECGEWSEYYTNFCRSCGADMRGEQDDND